MEPNRHTEPETNLESMFRRDYSALFRYARRIVSNSDDAAEIAQETFLRLQQMRPGSFFAEGDRVLLYRVARNLAIDCVRREHTRRRFTAAARPPTAGHTLKSAEDELLARERRNHVRRAFRALSRRDAECLALRTEGRSYEELSVLLNIRPASVGPTVTRAFRRLRRAYLDLSEPL